MTTDTHPLIELSNQVADDEAAAAVLSSILRHQESDREMFADLLQSAHDHDRAEALALRHGVTAALASAPWGGTTATYEQTLGRIAAAVDAAGSGEIHDWYLGEIRRVRAERTANPGSAGWAVTEARHPNYLPGEVVTW